MNIVYLIGNGFDLNLGMKTSYRNFSEYYTLLPSDDDPDVIMRFKEELRKETKRKNWSDLESFLGEYLKNTDEQEAIELYERLIDDLPKYIKLEEEKCYLDDTQKNIFLKYLGNPYAENILSKNERRELINYSAAWSNVGWNIKLITFNYTRSIERLLGDINQNLRIEKHHGAFGIVLSAIEHIHGFIDDRIILGVNDDSQIQNDKLRIREKVFKRYVKPICNNKTGVGHDDTCKQWIDLAHLICLFGLSIGDTDKLWWNIVGKALLRKCKVIIFYYKKEGLPDGNHIALKDDIKDAVKDNFLSKTDIKKDLWDDVKKNIYVALNTDMFNFHIEKMNASNGKNNDINHPEPSRADDVVFVQNVMGG